MECPAFQFVPTAPCPFLGHYKGGVIIYTWIRFLSSPSDTLLMNKKTNISKKLELGAEGVLSIGNPTKYI